MCHQELSTIGNLKLVKLTTIELCMVNLILSMHIQLGSLNSVVS